MPKWKLTPNQQRKFLGVVFGFAGFLVWVNLVFLPQSRTLAKVRPELKSLIPKLAEIQRGLLELPSLEEELKRLVSQGEPAASRPPEEQLPDLLEAIAQMARATQVRLLVAKPMVVLSRLQPGLSGFLEVPIQVEVAAGYHPIGSFLDRLEQSDQLIRVKEFEIQGNPNDLWHHKASFVLQAYLVPQPKGS